MFGAGVGEGQNGASGRRLALVVATTDYLDASLRRLRAPAEDAADLRDLLADPDIGGFTVTSVINERAHKVRLAIEDFLVDRDQDDLLVLYLSCHGLVDVRRRLYFAARDTLKDRLASSGVDSHWLLDQLEDCRARRQVVILDCCFSGAFARGSKGSDDLGIGERLVGEGRGRVVLTASRGTEYSFEGEPVDGENEVPGSVFTSALIEGIRSGGADTDRDGAISVEDAYAFAFEQVRRSGGRQTPQRWLYGAEGSILLARVPAEVTGQDEPSPHVDSRPAPAPSPEEVSTPEADGTEAGRAGERSTRRPWLIAAVATIAAGAALVGVLLTQNREDAGDPPGGSAGSTGGTFTRESPWRLGLSYQASSGCGFRLYGPQDELLVEREDVYRSETLQMRQSGSFRYEVNDPGCVVTWHSGRGEVSSLPFAWEGPRGDSPVFESPGSVTVEVDERYGTPVCTVWLRSDADGRPLQIVDVEAEQPSATLESDGPGSVFISASTCRYTVSAGS
jgi:hypothetical protein